MSKKNNIKDDEIDKILDDVESDELEDDPEDEDQSNEEDEFEDEIEDEEEFEDVPEPEPKKVEPKKVEPKKVEPKKPLAKPPEPEAKLRTFISKAHGLKIVRSPDSKGWNPESKVWEHVPGKSIHFRNGRYITKDPEEIAFLDEYAKTGASGEKLVNVSKQSEALIKLSQKLKSGQITEEELNNITTALDKRKRQGSQGAAGAL